jgi:hypothetical protein
MENINYQKLEMRSQFAAYYDIGMQSKQKIETSP